MFIPDHMLPKPALPDMPLPMLHTRMCRVGCAHRIRFFGNRTPDPFSKLLLYPSPTQRIISVIFREIPCTMKMVR